MAKRGRKPAPINYKKIAEQCATELADKKKALAKAEKTLATATKNHQQLLAEVARLDMAERSMKALAEGTEPPQNIRYVYTYPQWVWQPYPNQWWYPQYNGTGYTITLGQTQTQTYNNFQGGMYSNANAINTINTTTSGSVPATTTFGTINSGSGLVGQNNMVLASSSATPGWQTSAPMGKVDFTVDLSTGATENECDGFCEPACAKCAVKEDESVAVGHGG